MQRGAITIGLLCCCLAGIFRLLPAAEIHLRPQAESSGSLVLLRDVARVLTPDEGEALALGELALFPAPPAGSQRAMSLREVQDALAARGVDVSQHSFSGSSRVTVTGPAHATPRATLAAPVRQVSVERAHRTAQGKIRAYLQQVSLGMRGWEVALEVNAEQAAWMAAAGKKLTVSGGERPWTGRQQFELRGETDEQGIAIEAQVTLPPAVVVVARPLPRGAVVRAGDLEMAAAPGGRKVEDACSSLEEVVGREAVQALRAGQVLTPADVRAPLLVRRGEAVTVHVRSRGVHVRTTARARQDGAQGEAILVESLADRQTFTARVSGIQQVEAGTGPAPAE